MQPHGPIRSTRVAHIAQVSAWGLALSVGLAVPMFTDAQSGHRPDPQVALVSISLGPGVSLSLPGDWVVENRSEVATLTSRLSQRPDAPLLASAPPPSGGVDLYVGVVPSPSTTPSSCTAFSESDVSAFSHSLQSQTSEYMRREGERIIHWEKTVLIRVDRATVLATSIVRTDPRHGQMKVHNYLFCGSGQMITFTLLAPVAVAPHWDAVFDAILNSIRVSG